MLSKRIPLYVAFLISGFFGATAFILAPRFYSADTPSDSDPSVMICRDNKLRLDGYKYIKPLLLVETNCEAPELMSIKSELLDLTQSYKANGYARDISLYLRKLNQGEWIEIGEDIKYLPGSLMKVPELITFMKMNEVKPGLLDQKVTYSTPFNYSKTAHYTSKSIELGHTYSIRELLYYMIVYSDNNATILLNQLMDFKTFMKVFTDMGIPEPDMKANEIPITAQHFSRMMRAIFNSTYLSMDDSEFCAELLTKSDFANGIRGGVPENIAMAHKFGEAGTPGSYNFCESGIVYSGSSPYLLTVMTRGNDMAMLPKIAKDISSKAYQMLSANR